MPYSILRNKNGTYRVINDKTGEVLSKATTMEKAKKQIKAIHVSKGRGMRPEHRIRYYVSLLKDRPITNQLHRHIIDFTKELLKAEEMRGAGFWDDVWSGVKDVLAFPAQVVQEVPFVKQAITAVFPEVEPVLNTIPKLTKYIYGDDTNQWLSDMLSDVPILGDIRTDKGYKTTKELEKGRFKSPSEAKAEKEIMGDTYTERLADQIQEIETMTPQMIETPYTPYEVPTYNPIRYNSKGEVIPVDVAIRFPIVYDYLPGVQPKPLRDKLIEDGVAGRDFARKEFGSVVLNQQPYAFLDYPINGGAIRKIDYSRLCY
jgi:hypothetical protein